MSDTPFKIGDRVVCIDDSGYTDNRLALNAVYVISDVHYGKQFTAELFVKLRGNTSDVFLPSRFVHDEDTPCPSLDEDYTESSDDYKHNKPHHVIVWGAASLLIWLAFFAGLWCGWMWL